MEEDTVAKEKRFIVKTLNDTDEVIDVLAFYKDEGGVLSWQVISHQGRLILFAEVVREEDKEE